MIPTGSAGPGLAALLRSQKDVLIRRWARRILDDPSVPEANQMSGLELRDHVPALLDRVINALEQRQERPGEPAGRAAGGDDAAQLHARQRFEQRYSMGAALRELSHLRAAMVDLCCEAGVDLRAEEAKLMHVALDEGMAIAAVAMEREAVAELRDDAAFRERFMGILGHDLRNPLSSIALGVAFLLRRGDRPAGEIKALARVLASAQRMDRMIRDLLDVTRSRSGGALPLAPKPTDLRTICKLVVDELEAAHPQRSLVLRMQGDLRGTWDPDRIAQAVSNLVGNALDYSAPGSPITVTAREQEADVILQVHNVGAPIPAQLQATIFEPFRRGDQPAPGRTAQGLGLGLFITRDIVRAHGGSIEVKSEPDEGTTFTVRLPRDLGGDRG